MIGGIIFGIFQIKAWNDRRAEKSEERFQGWIKESDARVIDHINKNAEVTDSRFKIVDTRMVKDEEDIEDVEDDMKQMVKQFQQMCDKLSKHGYIIDTVVPDFHKLKTEFYKFKNAVDTNTKVGFTGVHTSNDNINDPENEREKSDYMK
jgi:uncharacterized protein YbcV (DUF1398 family)